MGDAFKNYGDVQHAEHMLGFAIDAYLRSKGWEHTSTTPGCLWLWVKTVTWTTLELPKTRGKFRKVRHERLVMTDRKTALSIQRSLEEDA